MPKRKTKTLNHKVKPRKASVIKNTQKIDPKLTSPAVYSWRLCPYGEHWVKTHPMHVPPSKTHPEGSVPTRHEHCARNPSGKDQLYPEEIQEIAHRNFNNLKNKPCPQPLIYGVDGNKYDDLIAGWTQYWNEVLKPDDSLDPNLVKAFIASESGFNPNALANKKNSNSARGLMQITNESRKLLSGDHEDLKDHLITVTKEELNDPNLNICAGIRWLFEKRRLLSSHLKKPATWLETIWDYKAVAHAKTKKKAEEIKTKFNNLYEELQKCEKNIGGIVVFFFLLLSSIISWGADNAHLEKFKSKFPNGLLSDDYGVLNLKDLALNACRLKPPPFIPGVTHSYQYWICFESKNILPTCDDEGIDETEGHIGRVNIEARNKEMVYQFFESRPWPLQDCRSFVRDLKRIMKGTSHACISASSITKEEKNEKGHIERIGFFHRLKTRKGCEGEECELTKKFKKKYCPEFELGY